MIKRSFVSVARKTLLRRGRALLRRSEKNGAGPADFLGGLSAGEREELAEIHQALERIERGIYGRCEACSGAIDEDRLQVQPWVRDCTSCASETDTPSENEGVDSAHLHH